MTTAIVNHLWQSTVIVIAAALVALALRRNQARTRHAVWLAASLKFLLPFSLLISLGGTLTWRTAEAPVAIAPTIVETVQTMTEPFAESSRVSAPASVDRTPTAMPWSAVLASVWIVGTFVVLAVRLRGWLSVRAVLRASAPATLGDVEVGLNMRAAPGLLEPGVVGVLRPVLLVPVGLESTLSADQLRAVVAHELHHIRRRDNLTSTLHMIVEALFWFHPLVWWVGARLIDERERACDEYVLASGAAADAYAEGILNVCKRYVESPVACVSGVTGADLKKRIGAILAGRVGSDLSIPRKALIAIAAVMALAVPVVAGIVTAPLRTYSQPTGPVPKFEVVSVRPCDATVPPHVPGAGRGSGPAGVSPGRLSYNCGSLLELIRFAYSLYADGHVHSATDQPVLPRSFSLPWTTRDGYPWPSDLPEWIWKDKFAIEAKGEGEPPMPVMLGPMLQSVLEDKFKLKVHCETREVPTYELVVAKGGSKLTPAAPGECVPYDFSVSPQVAPPAGQHRCDELIEKDADGNFVYVAEMMTLDDFFAPWGTLGRPLVNKTGIAEPLNIRFVQPTHTSGADEQMSALVAALKDQLGLELRPGKGPLDFLVIDHAERPDFAGVEAPAQSGQTPTPPAAQQIALPPKTPDTIPNFDVVSVRPCASGAQAPSRSDAGRSPVTSPGRLYLQCYSLSGMFQEAYVFFAGGRAHGLGGFAGVDVEGGPDWKDSDRFVIEAKTNQNPSPAVMRGPMLQAVLEERFKLKVHRETRQMPIYELVAAKSGAKISPYTGHDCVIKDDAAWPVPGLPVGQRYCGDHIAMDGDQIVRTGVMSLDQLLTLILFDRPVVNKTGITAPVSYRFEYARADARMGEPPGASIVKALRDQLGLDLRASKGPRLFLVIDHAERPTGDGMRAK